MTIGDTRTLALFVLALSAYFLVFGQYFLNALLFPDWLIAPIMSLGSFVAGSTFLGGGAVAFPSLTKILQTDPNTAKTFSLAIQSVGMTSASLYIITRVKNLPVVFILTYLIGAALGVLISLRYLESIVAPTDLRIGFTLFILCFLCVYLWTYNKTEEHLISMHPNGSRDFALIISAGMIGGGISGLLGSGADLIAFCLLALYFKSNIKLATQTSVVVMAAVSIIGITAQGVWLNNIPNKVFDLWYIAAPIVMIGAPLGAYFCLKVKAKKLLLFICTIVILEVLSTLILIPIPPEKIKYYLLIGLTSVCLLLLLQRLPKP